MENSFWLERWERSEIGFHQPLVNVFLRRYWTAIASPHERVFVPLCGKSLDMLWLRDQGHPVLGVELSDIAAIGFFFENHMTPLEVKLPGFDSRRVEQIEILCGDYFDLGKTHLDGVGVVYDRAALVAFPPELRESYVEHMARILPTQARMLLITFDYNAHEMQGPPFAVSPDEVTRLFSPLGTVRHLETHDALADNPRFRERGASRVEEHVFLITFGKT
ncbi:MAG: thiopurine S-methyltransferase [Ferrovum sp.]|nr:thiopurine S-methyltransferase [Ferrovum sp.]NDU87614.1 thiopurine S-methyltransferase [Ferrovum sp.]